MKKFSVHNLAVPVMFSLYRGPSQNSAAQLLAKYEGGRCNAAIPKTIVSQTPYVTRGQIATYFT